MLFSVKFYVFMFCAVDGFSVEDLDMKYVNGINMKQQV